MKDCLKFKCEFFKKNTVFRENESSIFIELYQTNNEITVLYTSPSKSFYSNLFKIKDKSNKIIINIFI